MNQALNDLMEQQRRRREETERRRQALESISKGESSSAFSDNMDERLDEIKQKLTDPGQYLTDKFNNKLGDFKDKANLYASIFKSIF